MDDLDRQILAHLHAGIPIERDPYQVMSRKMGCDSADLLIRMQKLRDAGVFHAIRAGWGPKRLPYKTAWGALRFEGSEYDRGVMSVHDHPGVFYSCKRSGEFDFWFCCSLYRGESLEAHFKEIGESSGASKVFFSLPHSGYSADEEDLSIDELKCIETLSQAPDFLDTPYESLANVLGLDVEDYLEVLRSLVRKRYLRNISLVVPSEKPQILGGALIGWRISDEKLRDCKLKIFEEDIVAHCWSAEVRQELPYNLFAVLSSDSLLNPELVQEQMAQKIGRWEFEILNFEHEFLNRRRVFSFTGTQDWLQRRLDQKRVFAQES